MHELYWNVIIYWKTNLKNRIPIRASNPWTTKLNRKQPLGKNRVWELFWADVFFTRMSTTVQLAKIKSRAKGHHEYQYCYQVGEKFRCYRQPGNFYSWHAIIVKSRNNKTIGHIPDGLAKVIHGLMVEGKINRIDGKITGEARSAPEGTWSQGGGIELPCNYKIYGNIDCKSFVKSELKKGLM